MQTKRRFWTVVGLMAGLAGAGTAQAALYDRGGGLIYDDVLNITWLQDANYAKTSGYDSDGRMNWDAAMAWAGQLVYGGYDDWRLPVMVFPAPGAWAFSNNGTTTGGYGATGSGWGPAGDSDGLWSELGWMWYHNLGNLGYCTPNGGGSSTSCDEQTGWGLKKTGPFSNLQDYAYWSGTEYAPNPGLAWDFGTYSGVQSYHYYKSNELYAWAVRPGDVAAAPEPGSLVLLGAGLAGLGWSRRRVRRRG